MKTLFTNFLLIVCLIVSNKVFSQTIPSNRILKNFELIEYLKDTVSENFKQKNNSITLAAFFRKKFEERYFFSFKQVKNRFNLYQENFPENGKNHLRNGLDHFNKYPENTNWKLPFNYKNGEPVNSYAIRHLARQHKMLDIAMLYHYSSQNSVYLNYFKNQLKSLNSALETNNYETIEDGNGVYEAFRSGYRILNWLRIHQLFLHEKDYSDDDQLLTISTLLQHASHLYETNQNYVPGNHQTRGMSALAMLSILFSDFKDADLWYTRSTNLLLEHLDKEINDDGFQFERSVHYHISDIENYFFVYQLAKLNNYTLNPKFEKRIESLFTTLIKIAYPTKFAPVLQDDTDIPWAEKNDISEALTLGYLLFENDTMGYFSNGKVDAQLFWHVSENQLEKLKNLKQTKPNIKSVEFKNTGYYIMREGWDLNHKMLIISAGVDPTKPDHQHGDVLGIQAIANQEVILPNYQVRYSLPDYEFFKNSMVKNVALVNNELQGKQYKSNKGGSGFGKFLELPTPNVLFWDNASENEVFIGNHNGFENIGVSYSRQVFNLQNDFWLVKDNFTSVTTNNYKQVWQGHYTGSENLNLLRSTFSNGSGLDIYQFNSVTINSKNGTNGKEWTIQSKNGVENFSFITALYPYPTFDKRLDESKTLKNIAEWEINTPNFKPEGKNAVSLHKENQTYLFAVNSIQILNKTLVFLNESDIKIIETETSFMIQNIGDKIATFTLKSTEHILAIGDKFTFKK